MNTARISAPTRNRHAFIDYLAFLLLFASVSIAVAVALGGIVLLLTPSGDASAPESSAASATQLIGVEARQAGTQ